MLLILSVFAAAVQPAGEGVGGTTPIEADSWAWLNIPDVEGPASRFSYFTGVRRDGSRLQARLRYEAPARTEALVELDCAARTQRTLERTTDGRTERSPGSAPASIASGTRESVLAYLLCPGGGRP